MPAVKPVWLDKKINLDSWRQTKRLLRDLSLSSVCEQAMCPNIGECFANKTATFMILGTICTRHCSFCAVRKMIPGPLDDREPERIRQAVEKLGLSYVVITSPTRDDLDDGGAKAFCLTVEAVKSLTPGPAVEILIPDMKGEDALIEIVAACGAEVVAHNLETCPSLYIRVRKGADYSRSLKVLERLKRSNKNILTKSGLMLGLGESREEVMAVLADLRQVGCDILTLGQYLAPSKKHHPVKEYISPERFQIFQQSAYAMGFLAVKSAPYVRSSYQAHTYLPR